MAGLTGRERLQLIDLRGREELLSAGGTLLVAQRHNVARITEIDADRPIDDRHRPPATH